MNINLSNLQEATQQQIFNQVAVHLMNQGKRSTDADGRCLYRDGDGNKCAAGCLIGDNEYDPSMENKTWWTLAHEDFDVPRTNGLFVFDLQKIHDYENPQTWKKRLLGFAAFNNLSADVLNDFPDQPDDQ